MSREKRLESMLIIAAGFIVLFLIVKIKWFLLIALAVAILGAMSKIATQGITWAWFKISEILGWINSRVLLGAIFFLFLFPISLLMRALNKITIKMKKQKDTYYSERNHTYTSEDLENSW
ncbi:MAG TPA: SxtJ family membrane protein [Bacteroidia bacterium]|jgi:hypothetical protein|nr:SxtJ family membrane protein [Bacteroidia bacterium]